MDLALKRSRGTESSFSVPVQPFVYRVLLPKVLAEATVYVAKGTSFADTLWQEFENTDPLHSKLYLKLIGAENRWFLTLVPGGSPVDILASDILGDIASTVDPQMNAFTHYVAQNGDNRIVEYTTEHDADERGRVSFRWGAALSLTTPDAFACSTFGARRNCSLTIKSSARSPASVAKHEEVIATISVPSSAAMALLNMSAAFPSRPSTDRPSPVARTSMNGGRPSEVDIGERCVAMPSSLLAEPRQSDQNTVPAVPMTYLSLAPQIP